MQIMCNRHNYLIYLIHIYHYIGSIKVGLKSVMSPRIVKILVSPVVMFLDNVENGIINHLLNSARCIL